MLSFHFKGLVPAVFSGTPPCSTTDVPTPIPDSEMIAENWDPFVLRDGSNDSCLHFPFLSYDTVYFKVMLPKEMTAGHNTVIVHSMDTVCSPYDSYMMTEMAPVFKGLDVVCRHKCHLTSDQSFIFLVVVTKDMQICEIAF